MINLVKFACQIGAKQKLQLDEISIQEVFKIGKQPRLMLNPSQTHLCSRPIETIFTALFMRKIRKLYGLYHPFLSPLLKNECRECSLPEAGIVPPCSILFTAS